MTQSEINKYFQTDLGMQCTELFSTPDDRVFIRKEEADKHCIENQLDSSQIQQWFSEF